MIRYSVNLGRISIILVNKARHCQVSLTTKYVLTTLLLITEFSCLIINSWLWANGLVKKWATGYLANNVRLELSILNTIKQVSICSTTSTHKRLYRHITMFTIHGLSTSADELEFDVSVMNCQLMANKTSEIVDYIKHHDVDIVALTETWLNDSKQNTVKALSMWLDLKRRVNEWVCYWRRCYLWKLFECMD